jgi:PKD repeat protein
VSFDGSASTEPDGSISSYSWDFGDKSTSGSSATPKHAYKAPGTYTVTLTVTDSSGLSAHVFHPLVVRRPGKIVRVRVTTTTRGTAVLRATVNGPGRLRASDAAARPRAAGGNTRKRIALILTRAVSVSKAGTVVVRIAPSAVGTRLLRRTHQLRVSVLLTFTPDAAKPVSRIVRLTLRLKT